MESYHVAFWDRHLSFSTLFLRFIHVEACAGTSFSWQDNIPLSGQTTLHPLMGLWIFPTLWLS